MNVGNSEHLPLSTIASEISRQAGLPAPERLPFPDHLRQIDIGSYFADSTRFREATGWKPQTVFQEGVARTLGFYREHLRYYLPLAAG